MLWAIVVLLVLIFAQLCLMGNQLGHLSRMIQSASDLNLEAHARLLDATGENERHLAKMPKMAEPWER